MERSVESTRDKAILAVRLATFGGAVSAIGISWLFANLAESYFSGKPATAQSSRPPTVPVAAAPRQVPPTVVTTVVHHPSGSQPAAPVAGAAPRPPAQGPAPAPPPPPPPVCHSTPSHPC
jgi:hypothetical protein